MTTQLDTLNVYETITERGERVFSPRNLPTWAQVTGKPTVITSGQNGVRLGSTHIHTSTGTRFFSVGRGTSTTSEVYRLGVGDTEVLHTYINDEDIGTIRWQMDMRDTESSDGSAASNRSMTLSASRTALSLNLDGNEVFHEGNIPTATQVGARPASYVPTWAEITGKPATATRNPTWAEVTGKPTTFTPNSHTHSWSQITDRPSFTTRWPTYAEVSGKPTNLLTQTIADGRYLGIDARPARATLADNATRVGGLSAGSFIRANADDTFSGTLTASVSGNSAKRILNVGSTNSGILRHGGQNSLVFHSDSSCMLFAGDTPSKVLTGLGYYQSVSSTEDAIIAADSTVRLLAGQQDGYNGNIQATFTSSGRFSAPIIRQGSTDINNLFLAIGGQAADAQLLDGINSASFLRSDTSDSFSGDLVSIARNRGIFGLYDITRTDQIWSASVNFRNHASGINFGNLYGAAYKHTENPTGGTMADGHQFVWCQDGTPTSALGTNIWTSGELNAIGGVMDNGVRVFSTRNLPTAANVGLSNVNNWRASSSATSTSTTTYATSRAARDAAAAPRLSSERKRRIRYGTGSPPSSAAEGDIYIRYS